MALAWVATDDDMVEVAKKIQEYAANRSHTDEIPDLVLQLINVLEQASEELEEELTMFKSA